MAGDNKDGEPTPESLPPGVHSNKHMVEQPVHAPKAKVLQPDVFINRNLFYPPVMQIYEPLPITDPSYSYIGRIASDWARIEHTLDNIIWELANLDPSSGACITAQLMGVRPRCLTILALAAHRGMPKELIERTTNFMNKSGPVSDDRNRVIHDPWYLEKVSKTPAQLRSMPKGELVYGYVPRSKADMAKILEDIRFYATWATELRLEFQKKLEASREKP
jgi:hypothetical protein